MLIQKTFQGSIFLIPMSQWHYNCH